MQCLCIEMATSSKTPHEHMNYTALGVPCECKASVRMHASFAAPIAAGPHLLDGKSTYVASVVL